MHKIPLSDQVNRFVAWSNEQGKTTVDMTAAPAQAMIDDIDSLVTQCLDPETTDAKRDLMIDKLCSANAESLKSKINTMLLHREYWFDNETTRKLQIANILARLFQLPLAKKLTRTESSSGLASIVKTLLVKPISEAFDTLVRIAPGDQLNKARLVQAMSLIDANLAISELYGFNVNKDFDKSIRALTLLSQVDLTRNLTPINSKKLSIFVTSVLQVALGKNEEKASELLTKIALRILGNMPHLPQNPILLSCLETIIYVTGNKDYDANTVKLALRALAHLEGNTVKISESLAEQLKARLQSLGSDDATAIRDYTVLVLSKIVGITSSSDYDLSDFALELFGEEYLMSSSAEIAKSTALAIRALANSHPTVMDKVQEKLKEMTEGRSIDAIHSPALYSLITSLLDKDQLSRIALETCNPRLCDHALSAYLGRMGVDNFEDHFGEGSHDTFVGRLEDLLFKQASCKNTLGLFALMNDHKRFIEALQDPNFRLEYHQIRTSLIAMGPRIVPDLLAKLGEFRHAYDTSPERIRLVTEILAAIVTKPTLLLDKVHLQKLSPQIKEIDLQKLVNLNDYDSLDWKAIVRTLVDLDSSRRDPELHKKIYRCVSLNQQFCRKPLIELCDSENGRHAQVAENLLFEMGYTRTYVST